MRVRYDDREMDVSQQYIGLLKAIMSATCVEMRAAHPDNADCWTWGRAVIEDMASAYPVRFIYGGDEDRPGDGLGTFAVTTEARS